MYQHTSGAVEFGIAIDEMEMQAVTGGDAALWRALGAGLGYIAGQIANVCAVAQNPMSAVTVYHLYE